MLNPGMEKSFIWSVLCICARVQPGVAGSRKVHQLFWGPCCSQIVPRTGRFRMKKSVRQVDIPWQHGSGQSWAETLAHGNFFEFLLDSYSERLLFVRTNPYDYLGYSFCHTSLCLGRWTSLASPTVWFRICEGGVSLELRSTSFDSGSDAEKSLY